MFPGTSRGLDEIETLGSGKAVWEVEIEETKVVDLFMLELTITLDDDESTNEPAVYNLYVLRPGWSEAVERSVLLGDNRANALSERNSR